MTDARLLAIVIALAAILVALFPDDMDLGVLLLVLGVYVIVGLVAIVVGTAIVNAISRLSGGNRHVR